MYEFRSSGFSVIQVYSLIKQLPVGLHVYSIKRGWFDIRLFRGKISARPTIALRARKPTLIIADQNFKKSTESNI